MWELPRSMTVFAPSFFARRRVSRPYPAHATQISHFRSAREAIPSYMALIRACGSYAFLMKDGNFLHARMSASGSTTESTFSRGTYPFVVNFGSEVISWPRHSRLLSSRARSYAWNFPATEIETFILKESRKYCHCRTFSLRGIRAR